MTGPKRDLSENRHQANRFPVAMYTSSAPCIHSSFQTASRQQSLWSAIPAPEVRHPGHAENVVKQWHWEHLRPLPRHDHVRQYPARMDTGVKRYLERLGDQWVQWPVSLGLLMGAKAFGES